MNQNANKVVQDVIVVGSWQCRRTAVISAMDEGRHEPVADVQWLAAGNVELAAVLYKAMAMGPRKLAKQTN